ncbi:hypothetical protein Tco_0012969 [Tanacetum coccineum]
MENPEQAFVEYASSRTNKAGGKWYTFEPEQNNFGDTYNPSWKSHLNLRWKQPQNSQNNFSNPPNRFQPNGLNRSFNNNPQKFNSQSNLEGLVSNFIASQDARLSKFEAEFKRQQSKTTNKIDTVLKAITERIVEALPSDTVKNPKLNVNPTTSVLSPRSYPTEDPQCSNHTHGSINTITIHPKQQSHSHDDKPEENEGEEKNSREDINTPPRHLIHQFDPQLSGTEFVYTKGDDGDVMFIEIVKKNDDSRKEEPKAEGLEVEYFDIFPTRSELSYHKYLMCGPIPSIFLRNPIITKGWNFTYATDFMIVEYISSIINPRLSQVVLGKPFIEISNMTHDPPEGVVRFTNGIDEITYKMPHKIEQYNSLSDLEKEHTKSVYLRNEDDKRRGVEYVIGKILGFYKECLDLGPEYVTGMDDEGEVT